MPLATAEDPLTPASERRRPWWIWAAPFVTLLVVLVARNAFLFSTPLHEEGDSGANSILIQQALRFQLLVGHYSREGFNNPGPVYLYVQAAGQWLARDVLDIVPTDWNGQLLAVYALDSLFAALIVAIVYGWTRSAGGAASAFCVVLGCAAAHPAILTSNWMPNLLVLTFLVFLLAAASVAVRAARDLWIMALSGWMLIHGYAPFLFFVPLITLCAFAVALWPDRRRLRDAIATFLRDRRGQWVPAAVISAILILPMVLEVAIHWPGQFGKYISYSGSHPDTGHTAAKIGNYVLWFWWPGARPWLALILLYAAAVAVTAWLARGPLRRWLTALVALTAVVSLAFVFYVADAVDLLTEQYIGYFYWAVPFALLLVIVVAVVQAVPFKSLSVITLGAAIGGAVAFGFLADLRTDTHDNIPDLPAAVATLARQAHGRTLVLTVTGNAWVEAPGFLVQAERTGVPVCVDMPSMAFLVSSQFICTAQQVRSGVRYEFLGSAGPAGSPVALRFGTPQYGYASVVGGLPERHPEERLRFGVNPHHVQ